MEEQSLLLINKENETLFFIEFKLMSLISEIIFSFYFDFTKFVIENILIFFHSQKHFLNKTNIVDKNVTQFTQSV